MLQLGFADPASVHIHITNMTYRVWQDSQFTSMMALENKLDLADNTITVEASVPGCDTALLGILFLAFQGSKVVSFKVYL